MWTAPGRPTGTVSQHVPQGTSHLRVLLKCFRNHKSSQITRVVYIYIYVYIIYIYGGFLWKMWVMHITHSSPFSSKILYNLWGWPSKWKFNWESIFKCGSSVLTSDIETWLWSARLASARNGRCSVRQILLRYVGFRCPQLGTAMSTWLLAKDSSDLHLEMYKMFLIAST